MIITIQAKELKLGDVIQCLGINQEFSTGIVKQVKSDSITIYRPYAVTANFSYTGGVICYTGIEEYQIPRNDDVYNVFSRKELK